MGLPSSSNRECLESIACISLKINKLFSDKVKVFDHHNGRPPYDIPPLSLPMPHPITRDLVAHGCLPNVASKLSDAFIKAATLARAKYELIHEQSCRNIQKRFKLTCRDQFDFDSLKPFVEKQYMDHLQHIRRKAIEESKKFSANLGKGKHKPKQAFNQEFVPVLEKYFEYNAYPSAPDRQTLARKSMMTPRQIEVWFQNHRNRAKKEGKPLPRLPSNSMPAEFSLDSLEKTTPLFIIPPQDRKDSTRCSLPIPVECQSPRVQDREEHRQALTKESAFQIDSYTPPSHAFPAVFTSAGHSRHWATAKHRFSPPIWDRCPIMRNSPPIIPNIESVIEEFGKLTIKDLGMINPVNEGIPNEPWFGYLYTVPSVAPHPALVRRTRTQLPQTRIQVRAVPASAEMLKGFQFSSQADHACSFGNWRSLPYRRPHCFGPYNRAPSPDSPPSRSTSSRTSSFGSDCSTDSLFPSPDSRTSSTSVPSTPCSRSSSPPP